MTWSDILKIALTIVGGVGGIGIFIGGVIKFSADRIAERLSTKYELQLNKELEKYKNNLDGKTYISRAMFDKEFSVYQDLTSKLYEAYSYAEYLRGVNSSAARIIKRSELTIENPNLQEIHDAVMNGEALTQLQVNELKDKTAGAMLAYRRSVGESGAFIPSEIRILFSDIFDWYHLYFFGNSEVKANWNDFTTSIERMQSKLRNYLESLIIVE